MKLEPYIHTYYLYYTTTLKTCIISKIYTHICKYNEVSEYIFIKYYFSIAFLALQLDFNFSVKTQLNSAQPKSTQICQNAHFKWLLLTSTNVGHKFPSNKQLIYVSVGSYHDPFKKLHCCCFGHALKCVLADSSSNAQILDCCKLLKHCSILCFFLFYFQRFSLFFYIP